MSDDQSSGYVAAFCIGCTVVSLLYLGATIGYNRIYRDGCQEVFRSLVVSGHGDLAVTLTRQGVCE